MSSRLPIGIFDSGVGGLTVMRAVTTTLPTESVVYLGDTARVPYGNRSPQTVRRYAQNATAMLTGEGVKALVIACNTASAYALEAVQDLYAMPVIGVVEPVARRAAAVTESGVVGVIGTRGTIASGCYERHLTALGVQHVVQQACPLFVPLAEEGWTEGAVVDEIAQTYLRAFADTSVDTLILGCTHYPLLTETIQAAIEQITGRAVRVLDSASATAEVLAAQLSAEGLESRADAQILRFCATDDPTRFAESASRFFGQQVNGVEHVDIRDVTPTEDP